MLTSLSQSAYMLLENLLSPVQIDATGTTLEACIGALKTHFKPPVPVFAERHKFYTAAKSSTESINDWAVRVRALATSCDFGQHLEVAMRDKFVMGLEKGPSRDKIFLEANTISFQRVVEIANMAAYIQQQHAEHEVKDEPLNYINKKQHGSRSDRKQSSQPRQQKGNEQQQQQQPCKVCGYTNHKADNCKFKNCKCNKCKQRGHLKKMCKVQQINYVTIVRLVYLQLIV